jgi:hypothetical protein
MAKKNKRNSSARKPTRKPARIQRTSRATEEFNPDYTEVKNDLKRIGTLAGFFLIVLIALSFIL